MPTEIVVLLWRTRRGGTGDPESPPTAVGDRPEAMISFESSIAPHRDIGRTFRVDPGDRPTESVADID